MLLSFFTKEILFWGKEAELKCAPASLAGGLCTA